MNKLKRAMPLIITGIMVAATFVIRFMIIEPVDSKSAGYWLTMGVNAVIIVAMALTWMASGTERARMEEGSAFQKNSAEYSRHITQLEKDGRLSALTDFCKQKTEELLSRKINAKLSSVCIDRLKYDAELKDKTVKELIELDLDKKQIAAVEKIRSGKIRVRPINPMELMTNNKARPGYDVHYNESADRTLSIFVRAMKSIVSGAALALISFNLASNITDLAVWAMFLVQLVTIAFTAWSSEREGYEQIAVTKNGVVLRRIMFLNLFNEWEKGGEKAFDNKNNL